MNGYLKAALVGASLYLLGATFIGGSEMVRHPEWGVIMVVVGASLGVTTRRILQVY